VHVFQGEVIGGVGWVIGWRFGLRGRVQQVAAVRVEVVEQEFALVRGREDGAGGEEECAVGIGDRSVQWAAYGDRF